MARGHTIVIDLKPYFFHQWLLAKMERLTYENFSAQNTTVAVVWR